MTVINLSQVTIFCVLFCPSQLSKNDHPCRFLIIIELDYYYFEILVDKVIKNTDVNGNTAVKEKYFYS